VKTADKNRRNAYEMLRQATAARLTRRDALRMGLVAGTGGILSTQLAGVARGSGDSDADEPVIPGSDFEPSSPPTRPWRDPMPVPSVLQPTAPFGPSRPHQYFRAPYLPQKFYKINVSEQPHKFHDDLPESPIWGLEGVFPGPTIDVRYGEPWLLRTYNNLPSLATHQGFGIPQTIFHLHNAHTQTRSDGGPWDWDDPGGSTEYFHLMQRAGFSVPGTIAAAHRDSYGGDLRETLTTLFMHYHRPEFTGAGVYKGLVNFVRFFDDPNDPRHPLGTGDFGDETKGWQLPSGACDVPVLLADKAFDPDTGTLIFDQFNQDGSLGDKVTVNGEIQPFFVVQRRKYRFRVLNGGPVRVYKLVLRYRFKNQPFVQITDNGNFLERPRTLTEMEITVAERSDIIIDFSKFPDGANVALANIFEMKDGGRVRRDPEDLLPPDSVKNQILQFRVRGPLVADPSRVPAFFRALPPIDLNAVVKTRFWQFKRDNGAWVIRDGEGRDNFFDPEVDHLPEVEENPPYQIKRNTAERWILENGSGGWEHPIHIHFEEGQILKINGKAPAVKARKDMYQLQENTKIELFMRFRDFPDPQFGGGLRLGEYTRYVMHCHNLNPEDHSMMLTWNLVP
jgi:FtsP/CotA-like multicopper oxidase with cupredoxin domain